MGYCSLLLLLLWFALSFLILGTYQQLQSSQIQVLLQLKKHLEYPDQLETWKEHGTTDYCYMSSGKKVNITCQDNLVTELRIMGYNEPLKDIEFNGFAIPNQTLSDSFSMDSFFTTLARLSSLRVLSLVSLGIWGPIPDKIHRLSSLEYLDLSSNFIFGSIPPKVSVMEKLQTLIIDNNFLNDTLPSWFDSLSNLRILSLRNNMLKGPFPASIGNLATLTDLAMSNNEITGQLPNLSNLGNLSSLNLSGNKLNSLLPTMPKGLIMVSFSKNSFSGEIPHEYGDLSKLQHLDLSSNKITGMLPAEVFSLPDISYLNIGSNMLAGLLPEHLSCGSKLGFVDISNNRFTGGLPFCLRSRSKKRIVKLDGNCISTDLQYQHAQSRCKEIGMKSISKQSRGRDIGVLLGLVLGIFALIVLLALGFHVLCRRYCRKAISEQHLLHKSVQDNSKLGFGTSELVTNARFISQAANLGTQGLHECRSFSLEDLIRATNNFENAAFMGEGSYGKLYKGRLENGTEVAIRCLPLSKKYTIRNLKLRLDLLSKLQHPHLVCLLGHCIASDGQDDYGLNKLYLVYEFVPNGSFHNHLLDNSPGRALNWSERLAVLIGVAKAVNFLHTGVIPAFYNNRLKTSNILLNQHRIAKLSDYGLSVVSEETDKYGASDEGFKAWQMKSLEDDTYSFGFIILDAIVGPSLFGGREAFPSKEMASLQTQGGRKQIVESTVLSTCSQESLSIVISLINKCICPDSSRPSFEDVLWNLQYAAQVQATPNVDQRSETV